MSTRIRRTRRRRRTNNEPTSRIVARAGVVALFSVGFLWLATTMFNGVPGRDYGKLFISAKQLGNLATHDPVRISGVRAGQVMQSDVGDDGRARLELQLEPGVRVPEDSKVRIRANGLLGARYVEILPGTSTRDLARSGTLQADDKALTYGLPEALDTFDTPTRRRLADLVGGLGQGLLGQGIELNETGRRVSREVDDANAFLDAVNSQPEVNARLVDDLAGAMQALDREKKALGDMLAPTAKGLAPIDDERAAVQTALERAPGTLRTAGTQLNRGRRLLAALRSLSVNARATLADAPGGLRATVALLAEARSPVRRTDALLHSAARSVKPLLGVTDGLRPVLRPIAEGTDALRPVAAVVGRHGCDLQNFATTWRSMTGYGGPGEGPAGPAMAFRLQITPPGIGEVLGAPDEKSVKNPYPEPCTYKPSVYPNLVTFRKAK